VAAAGIALENTSQLEGRAAMVTALVSVVVVDDHPFFRDGVSRGLTLDGRCRVEGEASTGREALDVVKDQDPDVALIDFQMPDMDGIAVVHALKRDGSRTKVLLVSAITDGAIVFRALEEGAAGYLSKEAPRSELIEAVLRVARGETVIPVDLAGGIAAQIRLRAQPAAPVLSAREREVLQGFARGLSIPQLAAEMFLAPSTVKTHAQRLYEKLEVSDRAAAVAAAMRQGLLE
jgi:two-component system, NarL family, nitrate/nitrite response regulator NarL